MDAAAGLRVTRKEVTECRFVGSPAVAQEACAPPFCLELFDDDTTAKPVAWFYRQFPFRPVWFLSRPIFALPNVAFVAASRWVSL